MSPGCPALLRGVCGCWLLLAFAAPGLAEGPVYERLLRLPTVGDRIGFPKSVSADPIGGEIFVCDVRKNRILIFDEEGRFRFVARGGTTFSSPTDLAVDPEGRLVVLANHRRRRAVIELDFDGLFLREVAMEIPGDLLPPNLTSLALSPRGDRIYLMDSANFMLWMTDRDGSFVGSVDLAGTADETVRRNLILGRADVYGDRVLVTVASHGEIRIFDLEGRPITTVGKKGTAPCQLGFPTAAALDEQGNLFVIDQQRMVILQWRIRDNSCLGEHYSIGNLPGYLYFPNDLVLNPTGRLFVSQGFEGRVQAYEGLAPATRVLEVLEDDPDPAHLESEIRAAVDDWGLAWSEGRAEDHLDAYSADYRPWGVGERRVWETIKRAQLERDAPIEIAIGELRVSRSAGDSIRAEFDLDLGTSLFTERSRRTLLFVREAGGWKIIEERGERHP